MIYYIYQIVPREEGIKMKRITININRDQLINDYEELHMVEDLMMDLVDQLIGQGMSDTDVEDAMKFAMGNIF